MIFALVPVKLLISTNHLFFFRTNVPTSIRAQIKDVFPVTDLLPNTMHLGHPIIFSHSDGTELIISSLGNSELS
jgi:hypothetical protein